MAYRVVFSPEAYAHLASIYVYIAARAGHDVANRFTDSIVAYCDSFTTFPHRGTRREDLRPDLRTIGFRRRVTVAFVVDEDVIQIMGIFYGGRNLENFFGGDVESQG